jgi:hypothetical protein
MREGCLMLIVGENPIYFNQTRVGFLGRFSPFELYYSIIRIDLEQEYT